MSGKKALNIKGQKYKIGFYFHQIQNESSFFFLTRTDTVIVQKYFNNFFFKSWRGGELEICLRVYYYNYNCLLL